MKSRCATLLVASFLGLAAAQDVPFPRHPPSPSAPPTTSRERFGERPAVHQLPPIELNLTAIKHHAGEAAVGASAGAIAAWIIHRLQSTFVFLGVVGAVGTGAALHLNWITADQVKYALRIRILWLEDLRSTASTADDLLLPATIPVRAGSTLCADCDPICKGEARFGHTQGGHRRRRRADNG